MPGALWVLYPPSTVCVLWSACPWCLSLSAYSYLRTSRLTRCTLPHSVGGSVEEYTSVTTPWTEAAGKTGQASCEETESLNNIIKSQPIEAVIAFNRNYRLGSTRFFSFVFIFYVVFFNRSCTRINILFFYVYKLFSGCLVGSCCLWDNLVEKSFEFFVGLSQ